VSSPLVLFLDASILVTAAGSPSGGSSAVLQILARSSVVGAVSMPVLDEARRNVLKKLRPEAGIRLMMLLRVTPMALVSVPLDAPHRYPMINAKDAHVYAAAEASGATILLTLDRGLIAEVNRLQFGPRAITPGDFLTTVVPNLPVHHSNGNGNGHMR
jgi:predicted nucleic acid-binding protein